MGEVRCDRSETARGKVLIRVMSAGRRGARGEKMKWKWRVSVKVAGERRGTMALSGGSVWEVVLFVIVEEEGECVVRVGRWLKVRKE